MHLSILVLGRYGDPIDPSGFKHGLANMARLVKPGGAFYLSVPIGIERVEFNAHRVSDPRTVIDLARTNGLSLSALTVVHSDGVVVKINPCEEKRLSELAELRYCLGIFTFIKQEANRTER